ncbi:phage integrase N-terminal domain-containing protein [Cupriavidus sp. DF5525]|uniref:phage integrase N-terminal domain-containing protein n=1 Tax=Cupriavidus sp. DF5525 TaxID=3160989 RepID=UPI0032DF4A76
MGKGLLSSAEIDTIKEKSQTQALTRTVQDVIDVCNVSGVRSNKAVSTQTRAERQRTIHKIFKDLVNRTAFELIDPFNLMREHIVALVDVWVQDGLSARTIVTNLSALRIFCRWIGKGELVKNPEEYVVDSSLVRVVRARPRDKSQSRDDVIFDEKLSRIMFLDEHVGHQLLAIRAFGFKVQEAICFRPHLVEPDGVLRLVQGKKEGRSLAIPLDTEDRRLALVLLKEFASRNKARGGIADKLRSREAQKKRFHYVLNKCGVTLRGNTETPSERCPRTYPASPPRPE